MALIRSNHLESKLEIRRIPDTYPELVLAEGKRRFRNSVKGRDIFVANLYYNGKDRPMALIAERRGKDILLITLFPLSEREIVNRIRNRRWLPL